VVDVVTQSSHGAVGKELIEVCGGGEVEEEVPVSLVEVVISSVIASVVVDTDEVKSEVLEASLVAVVISSVIASVVVDTDEVESHTVVDVEGC